MHQSFNLELWEIQELVQRNFNNFLNFIIKWLTLKLIIHWKIIKSPCFVKVGAFLKRVIKKINSYKIIFIDMQSTPIHPTSCKKKSKIFHCKKITKMKYDLIWAVFASKKIKKDYILYEIIKRQLYSVHECSGIV